jgi:hypothetical protein
MENNAGEWVTLELELPLEMWDGQAHTVCWVDSSVYFDDRPIPQDINSLLSACTSNT